MLAPPRAGMNACPDPSGDQYVGKYLLPHEAQASPVLAEREVGPVGARLQRAQVEVQDVLARREAQRGGRAQAARGVGHRQAAAQRPVGAQGDLRGAADGGVGHHARHRQALPGIGGGGLHGGAQAGHGRERARTGKLEHEAGGGAEVVYEQGVRLAGLHGHGGQETARSRRAADAYGRGRDSAGGQPGGTAAGRVVGRRLAQHRPRQQAAHLLPLRAGAQGGQAVQHEVEVVALQQGRERQFEGAGLGHRPAEPGAVGLGKGRREAGRGGHFCRVVAGAGQCVEHDGVLVAQDAGGGAVAVAGLGGERSRNGETKEEKQGGKMF